MSSTPRLTVTGLKKSFGSNSVLHGIDLAFEPGQFIGLMGPNGAGKSTLIKILAGLYSADEGTIKLDDETVRNLGSRRECGFIHQDLGLIEDMSICENLRLGQQPMKLVGPILNLKREREAAAEAIARVGLDRDVDTPVSALSPGEKTLVAVARTLDRGARILFVDEATSTLPAADSRRLTDALRRTVDDGATVIMVSHKLSEILDDTDRVVVILDGEISTDEPTASLDREGLVERLVAKESEMAVEGEADACEIGEELIALEAACGGRAGPVDLVLRGGEITGLTGLPGSGLHDIGFLVHGSMRPVSGRVRASRKIRRALVPPHRETQGGIPVSSIRENLTLSSLPRWRGFGRLLALGQEGRDAQGMADELNVVPGDAEGPYGVLSGGNKQKVIFGRVLLKEPQVYVLCEPTRGVDIATRMEIYRLIRKLRSKDVAVLVISSDSEDLFSVCDRIGVVDDGTVEELVPAEEMNTQQLEALV
ncbi:MAG: sugar ABC transporter ATP-binding protein [Solirubrobacterales bacterium]|nr:sugar ABC transporter ATP-binding protein [Solirubrobacterales bacterium]